jgi:hypothetical protein
MLCQQAGLSLEKVAFRYDPFPIGFAPEVLEREFYDQLLDTWPADHLFEYKPGLGSKYSLSEINNADIYEAYIEQVEPWRQFHEIVKSPDFIEQVLATMRSHNIDLGYYAKQLSARFEFSMMSAAGGSIKPHTDAVNKLITLVLYMPREGEWDASYGGGTAMLRPRDMRRNFNNLNVQLDFDEVEHLHTYPYVPNGCLLFIKTFNSYHAVYPMCGPDELMRRSLTINIEDKHDPRLPYLKQLGAAGRKFAM